MQITKRRRWLLALSAVVAILGISAAAAGFWYQQNISPIDKNDDQAVRINIAKGATAQEIANSLEEKQLIRSKLIFNIYLKINGGGSGFQSGIYSVKRSQSLPDIVKHLISGKADERSITLYPGAVLKSAKPKPTDVFSVLKAAGYSEDDIKQAFAADYQSSILKNRPKGADLEGYIYGETYFVAVDASAEQVVHRAINQLETVIRDNGLEAKFKKQGLSPHEGIILASIIERESIGCPGQEVCQDQRKIASVFYNRLELGMNLGSDVTYHYIADKQGKERDFRLDSPYNTRRYPGLPPGPIATPGISALNAAADPAQTDYLFFLSGDDDVTYFAKTESQHNQNIRDHCQKKCLLP